MPLNRMKYLKYKESNWKTKDLKNKSGAITSFLKSNNIIDDDYIKYFNLIDARHEDIEYLKCPLCDYKTLDKKNKSGIFTIHLKNKHGITPQEFLIRFDNTEYKDIWKLTRKKIHRTDFLDASKDNHIICKECNKKFKSLSNTHLKKHNLTPDQYKKKYNIGLVSIVTSSKLSTLYATKNFKICKSSKEELRVREYIKSIYLGEQIYNSRKYTGGREIDIYLPSKGLGIEYAGLYYHCENSTGKDKKYHLEQLENCINNNIKLILIFSDEWKYKTEIVKSKLNFLLGNTEQFIKIHGRKCTIREISNYDKNQFLLENHLQGSDQSKIKLGAYFKDELVSVMTFGKKRVALGNKNQITDKDYELIRFAIKKSCIVHGIASKLLHYFILNYTPKSILTFADRRWSDGKLYEKMGFSLIKITPPNYWYTKGYETRMHRYNFTKHKILNLYSGDPALTEWENMKSLKYDRIWDCGNLKFEMNF